MGNGTEKGIMGESKEEEIGFKVWKKTISDRDKGLKVGETDERTGDICYICKVSSLMGA